MNAASFALVLLAARMIALAGHHVALTWWAPIAYLWHDAAAVLVFAALENTIRKFSRAAPAIMYAAAVGYVALNVPVMRVLSTPLTWAMWRAARGPLSGSIVRYATWDNALLCLAIIAIGFVMPNASSLRENRTTRAIASSMLVAVVAIGPLAAARVDTHGLERNAWTALALTAMPRALADSDAENWDVTGFERATDSRFRRLQSSAAGRNVMLVSLESTAAQYLGVYGATPDPMPNLSALAQHALVFDAAYAVYPESIKGLMSMLCSTYPPLDVPVESYATTPCAAVASELRRLGYTTGLFHSGRFDYLGMESVIRNRGFDTLADAGDIGGQHRSSFGVDEQSTIAAMLAWIDRHRSDNPFFLTYLPIAGHHPYDTPDAGPFPGRTELDRYRNALHYADAALGALMQGMSSRGLNGRTVWIVFGDHGEAFGQHDGNRGHTFDIFEENVHVPLLVAAPGLITEPTRSAQVVSVVDIAPTILDVIGVPAPRTYHGRSVLDGAPRMAFFFADYSRAVLGLRDGPLKMIYDAVADRAHVFDLDRDPEETIDRAADHAERTRWYARQLTMWSAAQRRRVMHAGALTRNGS